jgi:hypothetical protein
MLNSTTQSESFEIGVGFLLERPRTAHDFDEARKKAIGFYTDGRELSRSCSESKER